MGLTSLFLDMKDKHVLIIGTGSVGIRRARRFLDAEAKVSIIAHSINQDIKKEFIEKGAVFYSDEDRNRLLDECDLVVVATNNLELNEEIAHKAKDKLVNCASDISLSNVIVPSTFQLGNVTVSLYTGSRSPLMAKELRKKIQSIITPEDILKIELQERVRELLKENIDSQVERKKYMIKINEDENIQKFIQQNDIESATEYVQKELINK
ncbi:MAG: bifunctional precorrin-2 dehydrogenase/sirohydrochlorin ferrochelatase [Methanosphaera stadtmanae]|nr:bifunctional precorrin-2 dehydrogenase/sirohydrochlorin ferrochelatase [Methanosphaera stadtmanae]